MEKECDSRGFEFACALRIRKTATKTQKATMTNETNQIEYK